MKLTENQHNPQEVEPDPWSSCSDPRQLIGFYRPLGPAENLTFAATLAEWFVRVREGREDPSAEVRALFGGVQIYPSGRNIKDTFLPQIVSSIRASAYGVMGLPLFSATAELLANWPYQSVGWLYNQRDHAFKEAYLMLLESAFFLPNSTRIGISDEALDTYTAWIVRAVYGDVFEILDQVHEGGSWSFVIEHSEHIKFKDELRILSQNLSGMTAWLRAGFGRPDNPITLGGDVLKWNNQTIQRMATTILIDDQSSDFGVFADALEDAGYTDPEGLKSLRSIDLSNDVGTFPYKVFNAVFARQ